MSQHNSNNAFFDFTTAERSSSNPQIVTTSGTIALQTILEVAFHTKTGVQFTANGLQDLTSSILDIEEKLNAIMDKLGITYSTR